MATRETGKTRLESALAGRIPDVPPHFRQIHLDFHTRAGLDIVPVVNGHQIVEVAE